MSASANANAGLAVDPGLGLSNFKDRMGPRSAVFLARLGDALRVAGLLEWRVENGRYAGMWNRPRESEEGARIDSHPARAAW